MAIAGKEGIRENGGVFWKRSLSVGHVETVTGGSVLTPWVRDCFSAYTESRPTTSPWVVVTLSHDLLFGNAILSHVVLSRIRCIVVRRMAVLDQQSAGRPPEQSVSLKSAGDIG